MLPRAMIGLVLLVAAGCSPEMRQSFSDMFAIRDAVLGIVDAEEVGVQIRNGSVLSVTITNSTLNASSTAARKALADRVARIAYQGYSGRDALEVVYVVFAAHEQKFVLVSVSSTVEAFAYAPVELGSMPAGYRSVAAE